MRDAQLSLNGRPTWVKSTAPLVQDGLSVGDIWVDTFTPVTKRCTSITGTPSFTNIEGSGGGSLTDGVYGDITVSGTGTSMSVTSTDFINDQFVSAGVPSSTTLSLPQYTWVLMPLSTIISDPGGNFTTTGYKHIPTVAGKYLYLYAAKINYFQAGMQWSLCLAKNGTLGPSISIKNSIEGGIAGFGVSVLDMNGTSDYVQFYVNANGDDWGEILNAGGENINFMQIIKVG